MLYKGVITVERLRVSIRGLTILTQDAISYHLFLSYLLTNDELLLNDDLFQFDCSADQEETYLHKHVYKITRRTGGYIVTHVITDQADDHFLIRFGRPDRVRMSKLKRYSECGSLGDRSLMSIVRMGENNATLVRDQLLLRDVFSEMVKDMVGLRRLGNEEEVEGGTSVLTIPEQMFC